MERVGKAFPGACEIRGGSSPEKNEGACSEASDCSGFLCFFGDEAEEEESEGAAAEDGVEGVPGVENRFLVSEEKS